MKTLAILLILAHFSGDWLLQTRAMAENKSRYFTTLLFHLALMLSPIAAVVIILHPMPANPLVGALFLYAVAHGIQDWYLWRFYVQIRGGDNAFEVPTGGQPFWRGLQETKVYATPKLNMRHDYAFYSTIAIDQMLHLVVLFLIFL